ncbi:MAG: hypothetical protein R3B48_28215 [Kofleriaceae bacterium]
MRSYVALACLLAQSFALVHLFAIHHVRCAEHGDLLHVEDQSERTSQGALARAIERPTHAAFVASKQVAGHQGDHCTTLTERRDLRVWCGKVVVAAPPVELTSPVFAASPTLAARPLYRLAPKISPPLAA